MTTDYRRIQEENLREYGAGTRHLELFRRLYADRTHFIYEIIQNAEDARATEIEFRLRPDQLEIRHDGRRFNEADVRGVSGIDEGTGRGDLTRIGKFGIGFKSVHAYTESPEIHSGDEHFRIDHFVRPRSVEPIEVDDETLILLPFDRADEVSVEQAGREINRGLGRLEATVLLFLRSIERISIRLSDRHDIELRREMQSHDSYRTIDLKSSDAGEGVATRWIVFEREVTEPSTPGTLRVEAAFRLVHRDGVEQVARLERSPLIVFFATEKETRLGFLIQGPYQTTPARDNVPEDNAWNQRLIRETSLLVVDALDSLRDLGLLDVGALQALPIRAKDFREGEFFRPIFDGVRDALLQRALLPTATGEFVAGRHAKLARGSGVRTLLSDNQLALLLETPGIHWLSERITGDRTPDLHQYLLGQLDIEEVTPMDVVERLDRAFLEQQADDWMVSFYELLAETPSLWRYGQQRERLRYELPIIRLQSGEHLPPFSRNDHPRAYLPPESETEFPIVRQSIAARPEAQNFLAAVGLREPDAVAEVLEFVLPRYRQSLVDGLDPSTYQRDLERIVRALQIDSQSQRAKLLSELRSAPFLRARNAATADERLKSPTEVYVPGPTLETYFAHNPEAWFLVESIYEPWMEAFGDAGLLQASIRVFRRKPDGRGYVVLRDQWGWHQRGLDRFDPDTRIEGLEFAVAHITKERALVIWNDVLLPDPRLVQGWVEQSTRQSFENLERRELTSLAGKVLVEASWLPNQEGDWHKPGELSLEQLPDEFARSEPLAIALGMQPSGLSEIAKRHGISPEALRFALENPSLIEDLLRQSHATDKQAGTQTRREKNRPQRDEGNASGTTSDTPATAASSGHSRDSSAQQSDREFDSAAEEASRKEQRDASDRLITYVGSGEHPRGPAVADREVERAAIEHVLEREGLEGRQPTVMAPFHPGYDVESREPSGEIRLIEVKGLSGRWGPRGVTLTAREFETAREKGTQYWLYVVEEALSDPRLHRIQDPVWIVQFFAYDEGWKEVSAKLELDNASDS